VACADLPVGSTNSQLVSSEIIPISSFRSSYTLCVLFAYFFVESEKPNTQFKLSYWPRNELNFTGIPYIEIKRPKTLSD
jgi:hypothetical protein